MVLTKVLNCATMKVIWHANETNRTMNKWLTVKGVADYCMVSRITVRRWIRDGMLSATRLPSGHYRIGIADFRDFLELGNHGEHLFIS